MQEDRLTILNQAKALAESAVARFPNNISVLAAYCDVGIEHFRMNKDYSVYDAAITQLKIAEEKIGDPTISKLVAKYAARIAGPTPDSVIELPED